MKKPGPSPSSPFGKTKRAFLFSQKKNLVGWLRVLALAVVLAPALYWALTLFFPEPFQLKIGKMFARGQAAQVGNLLRGQLDKTPGRIDLWLELADLEKSQGDYLGAVASFQNYLSRKEDWEIRRSMALTMEQMGDIPSAQQNLEWLNLEHPNDPDTLWGLARLRLYQSEWKGLHPKGGPQQALKQAQKYLLALTKLKPHFALYIWELAEVSRELGDTSRALKAYEQVIHEDANYKHAHRYIARILAGQKQYRLALEKYEQAMDIEPNDLDLKKEAQEVVLLAPVEAKAREKERLQEWEKWKPPEEKIIAPSSVTIRVGIFTGLGDLLFRGESDLSVVPAPSGSTAPTPEPTPLAILKGGQDYSVSYIKAKPLQQAQGEQPSRLTDSWVLKDRRGKIILTFDQSLWIEPKDPQKPVMLHSIPSGKGYFFAKEEDRAYRGFMEILPRPDKGFNVINHVSLEDYTAGVLPSEMVSSWPMQALKAQAIAARTYVLTKMRKHNEEGFDVSDSVTDQVYRGLGAERDKSNEAVRQTQGLVVKSRGKLMPVVFSAECGGRTQDYEEAWGVKTSVVGVLDYDPPYNSDMEFPLSPAHLETWIKENRVAWCRAFNLKGYQNYRWAFLVPAAELQKRITGIGRIRRLTVTHRSTAGWADKLFAEGDEGNRELKADSIRYYLGGIRSNLIWIETQFNPQGWPEEFIIYGGGWGHGVGMCQVGCYGLAEAGKDCFEILRHYFPKGRVEKLGQ